MYQSFPQTHGLQDLCLQLEKSEVKTDKKKLKDIYETT